MAPAAPHTTPRKQPRGQELKGRTGVTSLRLLGEQAAQAERLHLGLPWGAAGAMDTQRVLTFEPPGALRQRQLDASLVCREQGQG